MKKMIIGGLMVAGLFVAAAMPAAAHEAHQPTTRNNFRNNYRNNHNPPLQNNRYRSQGRDWRRYRTDEDADHGRHHRMLRRDHRDAHGDGFRSREDHNRWHKNANEHHDGDHHRIYDRHARRNPFTGRRRR